MKQKLTEMKGKKDYSTIMVRHFYTPLSITDRTTRQEINEEIEDLNNTINHLDLIDIYRTIH